jgi:hypothetical protein
MTANGTHVVVGDAGLGGEWSGSLKRCVARGVRMRGPSWDSALW